MLPEIKTILYATDLKDKGNKDAFRLAVSMSKAHNARIIMLHGMEQLSASMTGLLRGTLSDSDMEELRTTGLENLKKDLHNRLDLFCREECPNEDGTWPGGDPIVEVMEGASHEVIMDAARKHGADLIVMGSRTHSGVGQLILGSTANKVIHHSKIPVVVYPL